MSQQYSLQSDQDALSKKPPTLETVQTYVHIATQWEEQNRILKSIEALQNAKDINITLKSTETEEIAIHIECKLASHWRTLGKYKIALTHYKNHLWFSENSKQIHARGIYGQYLWIDWETQTVVAKFSSNPIARNTSKFNMHMELFRSISDFFQNTDYT